MPRDGVGLFTEIVLINTCGRVWLNVDMSAEERALRNTGFVLERLLLESQVRSPMPRNLNIYFYVQESLAATYVAAQYIVYRLLERGAYLSRRDRRRGPPSEGADGEATLHTIEAYEGVIEPPFDGQRHPHELHIRLFFQFDQEDYDYWMIGGSVHLEPDNSHPDHMNDAPPYFGSCPLCGCLESPSPDRQRYHRDCRDGLGIELLLRGTVHGKPVRCDRGEIPGIDNISTDDGQQVVTTTTTPRALWADIDICCLASVIVRRRAQVVQVSARGMFCGDLGIRPKTRQLENCPASRISLSRSRHK